MVGNRVGMRRVGQGTHEFLIVSGRRFPRAPRKVPNKNFSPPPAIKENSSVVPGRATPRRLCP